MTKQKEVYIFGQLATMEKSAKNIMKFTKETQIKL